MKVYRGTYSFFSILRRPKLLTTRVWRFFDKLTVIYVKMSLYSSSENDSKSVIDWQLGRPPQHPKKFSKLERSVRGRWYFEPAHFVTNSSSIKTMGSCRIGETSGRRWLSQSSMWRIIERNRGDVDNFCQNVEDVSATVQPMLARCKWYVGIIKSRRYLHVRATLSKSFGVSI